MRPRESSPFYVWLTIGLMSVGSAAYVISYFLIDDFLAPSPDVPPRSIRIR